MSQILAALIGMILGAAGFWFILERKRREISAAQATLDATRTENRAAAAANAQARDQLVTYRKELERSKAEFDSQIVSYRRLTDENEILRRDLRNVDIQLRKLQLDEFSHADDRMSADERGQALARRFLKDTRKWISSGLRSDNFVASKERLLDAIAWCRRIGFAITAEEEAQYVHELQVEYEAEVRRAAERERAAIVRAQMRDELRAAREAQAAIDRAERDRKLVQEALDRALSDVTRDHTAEISVLRDQLAEAEARSQRAVSQAQLTKSGNVYVISNIGSFGENVFKVGMTRRLAPLDRVRELGDASVPFPFDVHMMIACDDAPALEYALHDALHSNRLNRVNPRREFFRTDIERIRQIVENHHGKVEYVATAEALQYRQSLTISDDDQEFIDKTFEDATDEESLAEDDVEVAEAEPGSAQA
jgi:hypothetical protein